jgi:hypothetical protein
MNSKMAKLKSLEKNASFLKEDFSRKIIHVARKNYLSKKVKLVF